MHTISREYLATGAVHFPSKRGRIFNKIDSLRGAKKGPFAVNVEVKDRKNETNLRQTKERKNF